MHVQLDLADRLDYIERNEAIPPPTILVTDGLFQNQKVRPRCLDIPNTTADKQRREDCYT